MYFKDKLVFLMKITQTSNKELAQGISVDPSLVSLMRSGKRKQPRNPERIKHISMFFASHCKADYQRNALAEMLEQSSIRSSLPTEDLAERIEEWLLGNEDLIDQLAVSFDLIPVKPSETDPESTITVFENETKFCYGEDGRREVMSLMMQLLSSLDQPSPILVISDDNLEWLLTDFMLTKQLQNNMFELIEKGFVFHQIMPAVNHLNRYAEALRFWLPLYSTGKMKVYYYPRLRDNLYRRSTIIVPGHCIQTSSTIGLKSNNNITLFSTDPALVSAYMKQYYDYLSMCRPAITIYKDPMDFFDPFMDTLARTGDITQFVNTLSVNTMPKELLEQYIKEIDTPVWKRMLQMYLDEIPHFEACLKKNKCLDISRLSSAKEVREGKVPIASPYATSQNQPIYTPESYILHLKNIVRLMEQYDNYFFVPAPKYDKQDYCLTVNENGTALMIRTSSPPVMLRFERPEFILACQEHLIHKAESVGYDDLNKTKTIMRLKNIISELQK